MSDNQSKSERPSDYTSEIGMIICERLVEDGSLRAICSDAGMPDKATVLCWLDNHKEFRDWYALARKAQVEDLMYEILEIADDRSGDWVEKVGRDGSVVMAVDHQNIARSKLRIDVRHWVADRLAVKIK
jgi:hypothetical protein